MEFFNWSGATTQYCPHSTFYSIRRNHTGHTFRMSRISVTTKSMLVNKQAESDVAGVKPIRKILNVTANEGAKSKFLLVSLTPCTTVGATLSGLYLTLIRIYKKLSKTCGFPRAHSHFHLQKLRKTAYISSHH